MLNLQTQHPSEQNTDGISQADIDSWNETDASEHSSNGEAPTEEKQATGLQRYYEILSFGAGLFLQSKSQLPADEVDETDGRDAEDKGGHKGDWGSHSGADKRADEQEVDENKVASINDWLKQNWGK